MAITDEMRARQRKRDLQWELGPGVCSVLARAADNDLYREAVVLGEAPAFRTRAGVQIYTRHVLDAIALGLLGPFQKGETLPDGTRANRIDLSDAGLETYLALVS